MAEARRKAVLKAFDRVQQPSATKSSIFVSFSGSGKSLADVVRNVCKARKVDIHTGFDAEVRASKDLPRAIMRQIKNSDAFLGIWTRDFDGTSVAGFDYQNNPIVARPGSVPSVWMPFELGIAAAHNKPFKILVVNGTHPLFYEKPFTTAPAALFEQVHFENEVKAAIAGLVERIEEDRLFPPEED